MAFGREGNIRLTAPDCKPKVTFLDGLTRI
jgi:hypothetical protein